MHEVAMFCIKIEIEPQKEGMTLAWGRQVAETLHLPKEVVLHLPLISMVGQEELTIENHKGLMEYSTEVIRIATGIGSLKICGVSLELKQMSADCIVVKGRVDSLEFLR